MKNSLDKGRLAVAKTYKLYLGGAFPRTESGRTIKIKDAKGKHFRISSNGSVKRH